ncbi:hypothetical protein [uncultured Megasphaera sp.]|nr:hypothetical protein [uncultured Megasphaera sp.]
MNHRLPTSAAGGSFYFFYAQPGQIPERKIKIRPNSAVPELHVYYIT